MPNLYPALGRQEVVVHTPRHARSLAELTGEELDRIAGTWRARAHVAREDGFAYVHALVNEGRAAGASLAHTHSQLAWLAEEPPAPAGEREGGCRVCAALAEERSSGARIVDERGGLVLLCPYASRLPYELLIAPVEHEADGFASPLLGDALHLLADGLRRLHAVEGASPINAWLHTAPFGGEGHWHLEVLPRFVILAGLELGAGIYVNSLAPEAAAVGLREAL